MTCCSKLAAGRENIDLFRVSPRIIMVGILIQMCLEETRDSEGCVRVLCPFRYPLSCDHHQLYRRRPHNLRASSFEKLPPTRPRSPTNHIDTCVRVYLVIALSIHMSYSGSTLYCVRPCVVPPTSSPTTYILRAISFKHILYPCVCVCV